jgi:hypothetical protein
LTEILSKTICFMSMEGVVEYVIEVGKRKGKEKEKET